MKRLVAKRTRVSDLIDGKFFAGNKEQLKPSYIITPFGEIISRVNICGTITSKFENEQGTYANVTLDDGTDAISLRVFKDVGLLKSVDVGDVVMAAGKMKEYNGERYVNAELVKKVSDKNYETYRRLELLKRLVEQKKQADELRLLARNASQEELKNFANEKNMSEEALNAVLETQSGIDYKSKILELISALDNGNGVEVSKIFETSKLPENTIESTITALLDEGTLYEPVVGRLKKV